MVAFTEFTIYLDVLSEKFYLRKGISVHNALFRAKIVRQYVVFITKTTSGELGFRHQKSTRDDLWCFNILLLTDFVEVSLCCSCDRPSMKRRHRKNFVESVI